MKTLINILLVILLVSSVALSQQQIQTTNENNWYVSGTDCSYLDSVQTGFYRTSSGRGHFGFYGGTMFVVGGWNFVTAFSTTFNPYLITPDTVSIDCEFVKGVSNRKTTCIYLAVQDSLGNYCFMGDDGRITLNSTWQRFSWDMSRVKGYGMNKLNRLYLEFAIETTDSTYTGAEVEVKNLTFIDNTLGTHIIDFDTTGGTGVSESQVQAPKGFVLEQNYPNPFNPSTTINYTIAHSGKVKLAVYSSLGTEVSVLVNETQGVGPHTARFNAQNLASGAYIYKLQTGNFVEVKKMLLVK